MEIKVSIFLKEFTAWASARSDIQALVLVGSQANGMACHDSYVDLVIITEQPSCYLEILIPERALSACTQRLHFAEHPFRDSTA